MSRSTSPMARMAALGVLLLGLRAVAADPAFEKFHLVLERNIFDPARVGHDPSRAPAARPAARPAFVLVGTLFSGPDTWAFFDGEDAGYRKVLKTGGLIADFRVGSITASSVELIHEKQVLTLTVAQGMTQGENKAWTLVGGSGQPTTADSAPAAGPTDSAAPAAAPIPADASDTLRRLLEQRKKQLQE